MTENAGPLETDPRFPSGRWVGFWIQRFLAPGRFQTELHLTFVQGVLSGEGRDWVGAYTVRVVCANAGPAPAPATTPSAAIAASASPPRRAEFAE